MNPLWKLYKSKVLKTLNSEYEEDTAEEVHNWSFVLYLHHRAVVYASGVKGQQVLLADPFG